MGLLDGFSLDNLFSDDPKKQAMLAMAAGLLGGSGKTNRNFGADLGNAGLLGMQAYGGAKTMQAKLAEEEQQKQMRAMQIGQMQRQNDQQQRIDALGPRFMSSGQPLTPNDDQGNTMPSAPPSMDWQGYSNALTGINPQQGLALRAQLAAMNQKNLQKLGPGESRCTTWALGSLLFSAPDKPHFVDAGDSVIPVDPQTGKPIGPPIKKNMSPDAKATDNRARAAQKQAEDHFQAGGNQYDPDRGVLVNTRSGQASPVQVPGGGTLPAKVPESIKKEIANLDSENAIIDGAIKAVKANPSAFSMTRGAATLAGTIPESLAGRMDKPQERQARAYLFNTVSKVINERAGAAQSAQELARLRSFLPGETDNAEQITDKMTAYKSYIKEKRAGFAGDKKADPLGIR
jgi:hypothetical protein